MGRTHRNCTTETCETASCHVSGISGEYCRPGNVADHPVRALSDLFEDEKDLLHLDSWNLIPVIVDMAVMPWSAEVAYKDPSCGSRCLATQQRLRPRWRPAVDH